MEGVYVESMHLIHSTQHNNKAIQGNFQEMRGRVAPHGKLKLRGLDINVVKLLVSHSP